MAQKKSAGPHYREARPITAHHARVGDQFAVQAIKVGHPRGANELCTLFPLLLLVLLVVFVVLLWRSRSRGSFLARFATGSTAGIASGAAAIAAVAAVAASAVVMSTAAIAAAFARAFASARLLLAATGALLTTTRTLLTAG